MLSKQGSTLSLNVNGASFPQINIPNFSQLKRLETNSNEYGSSYDDLISLELYGSR
jgi:hypothetical protein